MYQKTTTRFFFIVYLFHRTIWNARYLQAVRRIGRRKGEMGYFLPLGFLEIWFSQSEIKSWEFIWRQQQVVEVNSGCNEVSMKLQKPNSASNQSLSQQSNGSSPKLWIPDFGESVFPFEHLNLRNRVRVILLRHQLPRKLKIQRRTFIHNFILLKTQIYSFGVPNLWPFLQVCPWCCQLFKPWIGYSLIWYQS